MPLTHPRPWRITDTGSAFEVADSNGRELGYFYYRRDDALRAEYLDQDEARTLANSKAPNRASVHGAGD